MAPAKPLCETLEELDLSSPKKSDGQDFEKGHDSGDKTQEVKNKAHFYVYCANPCKRINNGKLRVRCADCKYGAFTVDTDLQSWMDVLQPKRITGVCNNVSCEGLYAEFYFKCADHPSQGENDEAVPLNLIRRNHKEVPCLACTDIR